jgi:hypothetical protein
LGGALYTALEYTRPATDGVGDAAAGVLAVAGGVVHRSREAVSHIRKAYRASGGWLLSHDQVKDEEDEEVKDELRRRQLRR